mgnify:CR=1 FL=1
MNSNLAFLFLEELGNTLIMTFASSALAYVIGIPLESCLLSGKNGSSEPRPTRPWALDHQPDPASVPFLILVIASELTRKHGGHQRGNQGHYRASDSGVGPLCGRRIVEASLNEVDPGVIEAAKSMGASTWQIIVKVLLPEAKPSLITNGAIAVTTILGYSAMAGFCGAGGLGAVAINYGYYRFEDGIMWIAILFLVILVQAIQSLGMTLVKKVDRRAR